MSVWRIKILSIIWTLIEALTLTCWDNYNPPYAQKILCFREDLAKIKYLMIAKIFCVIYSRKNLNGLVRQERFSLFIKCID